MCVPRSTGTPRARRAVRLHRVPGLRHPARDRAQTERDRAGTSCCPTIGHALGLIDRLQHSEMVGLNPEVGHEQMAGLNMVHGSRRRCGRASSSTSAERPAGPKYDQDLVFGHGDLLNAFFLVDLLEPVATRECSTSTTNRRARRDSEGVWRNAAANMSTYLMLKQQTRNSVPTPMCGGRDDRRRCGQPAAAHPESQ